jgi:hypothetical protein
MLTIASKPIGCCRLVSHFVLHASVDRRSAPMIEATRGLRGPRLLLSVAVLVLAIALVFRSLTPAVPQMADDLRTSIYDITVKVGGWCLQIC